MSKYEEIASWSHLGYTVSPGNRKETATWQRKALSIFSLRTATSQVIDCNSVGPWMAQNGDSLKNGLLFPLQSCVSEKHVKLYCSWKKSQQTASVQGMQLPTRKISEHPFQAGPRQWSCWVHFSTYLLNSLIPSRNQEHRAVRLLIFSQFESLLLVHELEPKILHWSLPIWHPEPALRCQVENHLEPPHKAGEGYWTIYKPMLPTSQGCCEC